MSEQSYRVHPGYPGCQPFNIDGASTKKRGWWLKGHNNKTKASRGGE